MSSTTIYLSFLGTGNYQPCSYRWLETQASSTCYAQVAELELLLNHGQRVSSVIIFGTKTSRDKHWNFLEVELQQVFKTLNVDVPYRFEEINEVLSTSKQWQDVQTILPFIPYGAEVILDMTHGFRSVPIVFSTALQFVQMIRNVSLKHVFYAKHQPEPAELIDYVGFYQIQEWTHAVQNLVENADARKLSELSQQDHLIEIPALQNSTELSTALSDLTKAIRDVKVNLVESRANTALKIVKESLLGATNVGDKLGVILLETVLSKFEALAQVPPSNDQYNFAYLRTQLTLTQLLLEHDFAMQAFTVMDEMIGSLGMLNYDFSKKIVVTNDKGRKKRRAADVFKVMLQVPRGDWTFSNDNAIHVLRLEKWYEKLQLWVSAVEGQGEVSILKQLSETQQTIVQIRNRFNHAWTSKNPDAYPDPLSNGRKALKDLKRIIADMKRLSDINL